MEKDKSEKFVTFAKYSTPEGRVFNYEESGAKSETKALSVPAFYSGVRFISETLAGLPKAFYQKDGKSRKRFDTPLTEIVSQYPNDLVNGFYLWETAIGHAVMFGNGYIWIERANGKPIALHNLHSLAVKPFRKSGKQFYSIIGEDGKAVDVPPIASNDIIHIRNFSEDGENGISVIDQLAEALGIPKKLDTFIRDYFDRGAAVNLVVEAESKLDREDVDTLRYGIEDNHVGLSNAHKVMILSNAKAKNLTSPLKDFAFDVLKSASIDDIARALRLPPHILYALGRATWNNLESLGIELVKYSLSSWVLKIELEINGKLLSQEERAKGVYAKWNLEGLQRGDYAVRVEAGVKLVNNRLLTPNEWRSLEELEPYEGGDSFYGPLNSPAVADPTEAATEAPKADTSNVEAPKASNPAPTPPSDPIPAPVAAVALNGAQIEAAVSVVVQLRQGVLSAVAAEELLVAAGLPREAAQAIVASMEAKGALPTAEVAAPDLVALEPTKASKPTITKQFGLIIKDACERVTSKQLKAFANHKDKEGFEDWKTRFAIEQGIFLGEALSPILETIIEDKTDLAFALQDISGWYEGAIKEQGEAAEPMAIAQRLFTKLEGKSNGQN